MPPTRRRNIRKRARNQRTHANQANGPVAGPENSQEYVSNLEIDAGLPLRNSLPSLQNHIPSQLQKGSTEGSEAHEILALRAELQKLQQRLEDLQGVRNGNISSDPLTIQGSLGQNQGRTDFVRPTTPPPRPLFAKPFKGKSMHEYDVFIMRMETHFRRHAWYFADNDVEQVSAAVTELTNINLRLWSNHSRNLPEDRATWEELKVFLMRLTRDPEELQRDALQRYNDAKQLQRQSVREFDLYLQQWESRLPYTYSEQQRKDHLRSKVLLAIRREALKYQEEPAGYEDFIQHLSAIEHKLPCRVAALRKAWRLNGHPRKGRRKTVIHTTGLPLHMRIQRPGSLPRLPIGLLQE